MNTAEIVVNTGDYRLLRLLVPQIVQNLNNAIKNSLNSEKKKFISQNGNGNFSTFFRFVKYVVT